MAAIKHETIDNIAGLNNLDYRWKNEEVAKRKKAVLESVPIGRDNAQGIEQILAEVQGDFDTNQVIMISDIRFLRGKGLVEITGHNRNSSYYRPTEASNDSVANRYGIWYNTQMAGWMETRRAILGIIAQSDEPPNSPVISKKLLEDGYVITGASWLRHLRQLVGDGILKKEGKMPVKYFINIKALYEQSVPEIEQGIEYVLKQVKGYINGHDLMDTVQPLTAVTLDRRHLQRVLNGFLLSGDVVEEEGKYSWNHDAPDVFSEPKKRFDVSLKKYAAFSIDPGFKEVVSEYLDLVSQLRIDSVKGRIYFPDSDPDTLTFRRISPDEMARVYLTGSSVLEESIGRIRNNGYHGVLHPVTQSDFLYLLRKEIIESAFKDLYGARFTNAFNGRFA